MIDFDKRILNSDKFRLAAIFFEEHETYCLYPEGTTEYIKYWDLEEERSLNGYMAEDGDWISGYNYFYLNYCPILRVVLEAYTDRYGKEKLRIVRDRKFADFYDYDYYYFLYVLECEDEGKHGAVLKARGRGYELPYSVKVLTPTGFVQMGDLKIGDEVMNPGGDKTIVTDIVELGVKDVYEVELRDGRKTRCGKNHLWSTIRNCHGKLKLEITTTEELATKKLIVGKLGKQAYPYLLPNINPLHLENAQVLPVDPYALGVLLGDDDISGDLVKFSSADQFIVDEMLSIFKDYRIATELHTEYKYTIVSNVVGKNQLNRDLKQLGVKVHSYDKFIPDVYKYSSPENRLAVVQGLMDTDGSITNGACTFVSTSELLVDDLIFMLRSLGIRCKKSNVISGRRGVLFPNGHISNTRDRWEVCITTQEDIFRLPRKLNRIRKDRKYSYKSVGIKSITKLQYLEEQRCIVVLNDNHLYITDDFIVTHNSFKGGSMLCRNYFLIPGSKSYAVASENEYLTKDGLLTKSGEFMDFIDKNTAWAKKRVIDRAMHVKSGVEITDANGNKTTLGYLSEIIGISLKNNADRIRGKRGKLILYEEAGMFSNILQAWQIARPSVEADGNAFGLMLAFGTGGSEGSDFRGLRSLFYECRGYNILGLPNIWDDNMSSTECALFVPQWSNMATLDSTGKRIYMDEFGNSLRRLAVEYALSERQIVVDNATDNSAVDRYIAERPMTPLEACLELTGNIFPKKELLQLLAMIRTNKKLLAHKQVGDLMWVNGELLWQLKKRGDITKYPLGRDDDPTGSIVIWEHPILNPPVGLYIAGCDPYDHDQAGTNSLGSTFIYKRFLNFEEYYDIIVAEYTGRPATAEEYYENVRKLLLYYNARLLYENERKGIFPYFTLKHCDYLLADLPDIINDIISNSKVLRRKGIHMTKLIRDYGEGLVKEWLNEEFSPGKKNLTRILSEPLLEELILTNGTINVDRLIAFIMIMIYRELLHNLKVKAVKEEVRKLRVFDLPLFSDEWWDEDSNAPASDPTFTFR